MYTCPKKYTTTSCVVGTNISYAQSTPLHYLLRRLKIGKQQIETIKRSERPATKWEFYNNKTCQLWIWLLECRIGEVTNIYYFVKYFCCNCCHQSPVVIFWQMHWLCKQCTAVFHSSGQLPSRPQVKAIFFFLCEPSSNSFMQCSHFDDVTIDLKIGIWIKFLKET